jgi:hypothetical protein
LQFPSFYWTNIQPSSFVPLVQPKEPIEVRGEFLDDSACFCGFEAFLGDDLAKLGFLAPRDVHLCDCGAEL